VGAISHPRKSSERAIYCVHRPLYVAFCRQFPAVIRLPLLLRRIHSGCRELKTL